jgi:hypothetical protein
MACGRGVRECQAIAGNIQQGHDPSEADHLGQPWEGELHKAREVLLRREAGATLQDLCQSRAVLFTEGAKAPSVADRRAPQAASTTEQRSTPAERMAKGAGQ